MRRPADSYRSAWVVHRGYLQGQGPFPERLPWILLSGQFLKDFTLMVGRWADWAADVVETWPHDIRDATPDWPTLEAMAVDADEYLRRSAERQRTAPGPAPDPR